MKILNINNLEKRYGNFLAVDNISLSVEEGEVFGLLGPNGAGKSTTINIIIGLLKSNGGEIQIFGKDQKRHEKEIKKKIGIVPQNLAIYRELSAEENIKFFGSIYGIKGKALNEAVEYALEFTGLLEHRKNKAKNFSGGMMRRLNIACGIVHKPEFVIMDEPTVGIDPQSRNHILESVKKLNKNGCTVIYTSHYMEEVENLCNRIAIMDKGKIIAEGTQEELITMVSDTQNLEVEISDIKKIDKEEILNIKGVKSLIIKDEVLNINSLREVSNLNLIIDYLTAKEVKIRNIGYTDINLETVFLNLTGRNLRD
ncbi:ABC transporter ATP-binding protein [Clostridium sp. 'White wine YQ']|uniref:ABC transporter ATP-binding protein n=1 Tax=Clostridium sp. 'White wine YQ' TaxID=3027474 RepID=UPI00236717C0|nr:ABC transporter ATP-binding protein [Clostridium sp. 'White wine YQ']MDD7795813.1 ABC transporter ATP-binding protein [Clostridium sp. 'White wine YQ']